jgi:uncharacterized protein YbjT (DUF2867 family)
MSNRILITGASGNIGYALTQQLINDSVSLVLGTRDGSMPKGLDTGAAQAQALDFMRPTTWEKALVGVDRVFLMRPPAISDTKTYLRPFIHLMKEKGIGHVVFLSLLGVNPAMPHYQVEQDLKASGLSYTMLRAGFFMQNLTQAYLADIRERDEIALPAGKGKTSFIDGRDIAAVARVALLDPKAHRNAAYDLTGAEALDYGQVAEVLSEELARPIAYRDLSFWAYWRKLRREGKPPALARVMLLINVIAWLGKAATITDEVPRLLGRAPIDLKQFVQDHRALWIK